MGASRKKPNKEYYAVVHGRVSEPTIFTSWGDVHPRVTCFPNEVFKGFHTLNEARAYMQLKGVHQHKEVIKQTALNTTPRKDCEIYYAVANGKTPGIYPVWYGQKGAFEETNLWKGSCHKGFSTKKQAEAFIQDWADSLADVCRMIAKEQLDSGLKPLSVKLEDLETSLRFGAKQEAVG